MNKDIVLNAIEHRMGWIYNEIYKKKPSWDISCTMYETEVKELYEAYLEIRGDKPASFSDIGLANMEEMYNAIMNREK